MKHVLPEFIAGLADYFGEEEYPIRSIALLFIVALGIISTSFLGIDAYLKQDKLLASIDFVSMFVFSAFLFLLIKIRKPHFVINVGIYFAATLFLALLVYGGENDTGFFWYFIFPVISCFFLGSSRGAVASSLLGAAALFYFVFETNNPELSIAHYPSAFSIRFLFCYLTIMSFSLISEMLREKHRDKLKSAKDNLEEKILFRTKELEEANSRLELLATRDSLTGVYNRLKLNEVLRYEFLQATRYKKQFSIILIDVDHFKDVNDTFGHLVGDKTLVELCRLIKTSCREVDSFGRWGGEEFMIIAPSTGVEVAYTLADKIRELISSHPFPIIDSLTISSGISCFNNEAKENELVRKADEALYLAKEVRDKTVSASLLKVV